MCGAETHTYFCCCTAVWHIVLHSHFVSFRIPDATPKIYTSNSSMVGDTSISIPGMDAHHECTESHGLTVDKTLCNDSLLSQDGPIEVLDDPSDLYDCLRKLEEYFFYFGPNISEIPESFQSDYGHQPTHSSNDIEEVQPKESVSRCSRSELVVPKSTIKDFFAMGTGNQILSLDQQMDTGVQDDGNNMVSATTMLKSEVISSSQPSHAQQGAFPPCLAMPLSPATYEAQPSNQVTCPTPFPLIRTPATSYLRSCIGPFEVERNEEGNVRIDRFRNDIPGNITKVAFDMICYSLDLYLKLDDQPTGRLTLSTSNDCKRMFEIDTINVQYYLT